jgi:RNA 2',3'-cyclic 3'-phosphodiesterase
LHLTLKFLGETPDDKLPRLIEALRSMRAELPIVLAANGVVCFPPRGDVRIVTAGIEDRSGRCAVLARRVDEACHAIGHQLEDRDWKAHITLARVKERNGAGVRAVIQTGAATLPRGPEFEAGEFVLMESRPGRSGSEYVVAARFSF